MIKTDPFVFTGSQQDLTCYMSRGKNILRKKSSLDAERVKKDPAFKGFRNSGNRMKSASPIAAALYATVPPKHRQYPLYRVLTGAALKLIKQGLETAAIKAALKKEHIDPLIAALLEARRKIVTSGPDDSSPFSYRKLFATTPVQNNRKIRQRRQYKPDISNVAVALNHTSIRLLPYYGRTAKQDPPESKYLPELIYLGRLNDASKLKMYQHEDIGFIIGFNAIPSILNL